MPSAPTNPLANKTAGPPPRLIVLLGDDQGNAPTLDDEVDFLIPLEIVRSAGSSPDFCRFELDLERVGQRVVDLQTPSQFARQVEVRVVTAEAESEEDEAETLRLFWGEINFSRPQIDRPGERIELVARVEDFHFGTILEGPKVFDPIADAAVTLTDDVELNPLIDGKIKPNMSTLNFGDSVDVRYWIDPESVRTAAAVGVQGADAELWRLYQVVLTLQELLNEGEDFVENDDVVFSTMMDAVDQVQDDIPEPENVRLRRGHYLPEYLDAVLHPWAFDWCLDYDAAEDVSKPTIRVFHRRSGVEKELYFQEPGEDLSLAKSNVPAVSIDTNLVDLANVIVGHGSLQQIEITVELYPGWPAAEDHFDVDDLRKSDPDSEYDAHKMAWRFWGANEAGDLASTRPNIPSEALNLGTVFDDYVPKRRRFEDCLAIDDDDGRRRPPFVEWFNQDTDLWESVPPEWGATIMRDQMGVMFTGDTPPDILREQGAPTSSGVGARIRVTGTVTGDKRVRVETAYDELSPQLRDVKLFMDVSDRFHQRVVQTSGPFASVLAGEPADTVDNSSGLEPYLLDVQANEVSATIKAQFRLFGLQFGYEVGDFVTKIDGRNIDLNRNFAGDDPNYIQITELRWLVQDSATVLVCEPANDLTD